MSKPIRIVDKIHLLVIQNFLIKFMYNQSRTIL